MTVEIFLTIAAVLSYMSAAYEIRVSSGVWCHRQERKFPHLTKHIHSIDKQGYPHIQ